MVIVVVVVPFGCFLFQEISFMTKFASTYNDNLIFRYDVKTQKITPYEEKIVEGSEPRNLSNYARSGGHQPSDIRRLHLSAERLEKNRESHRFGFNVCGGKEFGFGIYVSK